MREPRNTSQLPDVRHPHVDLSDCIAHEDDPSRFAFVLACDIFCAHHRVVESPGERSSKAKAVFGRLLERELQRLNCSSLFRLCRSRREESTCRQSVVDAWVVRVVPLPLCRSTQSPPRWQRNGNGRRPFAAGFPLQIIAIREYGQCQRTQAEKPKGRICAAVLLPAYGLRQSNRRADSECSL